MKRWPWLLCLAVGGALLAGALHADDQQLALRVWTLRLPGTELGLDVADMDGDGLQDLAIAHMKVRGGRARQVSVFRQGQRGERFAAEPAARYEVPVDACTFAAADLDPAPGAELVFLCASRVVIVRQGGEQLELPVAGGFFDYPEQGGLPVWDLVRDLDGDGRPELLVPTKEGYVLYAGSAEAPLSPRSQLKVPVNQRFGPAFETMLLNRFLTASSRLRRVVVCDLNGDGRQDLAVYRDKGLARFFQREDGSFPERPDREEPLDLVKEDARGKPAKEGEGQNNEAFANVRLGLHDLNGDGRAELIATKTVGEVGVFESLRTQQLVFIAREDGGWDEERPATVVNLKGISDDPLLLDWDGDGRDDLILSSYRMDMFSNVKRAITDSLTITYMIFRQREGAEPFDDDPDYVLDVEVPLDVLQRRGGHKAVQLNADLDGDGVRDMVARREDGGLKIVLGLLREGLIGDETPSFDEERPIPLAVPRSEPPRVHDLDGDGKDELILEPFGGDDAAAATVRLIGVAR